MLCCGANCVNCLCRQRGIPPRRTPRREKGFHKGFLEEPELAGEMTKGGGGRAGWDSTSVLVPLFLPVTDYNCWLCVVWLNVSSVLLQVGVRSFLVRRAASGAASATAV